MKIKGTVILWILLCNTAHAQYTFICKSSLNERSARKFQLNQDRSKLEEIFETQEAILPGSKGIFGEPVEARTEVYILAGKNKNQLSFQSEKIFYFSRDEPYKNLIALDTNTGKMNISPIRLSDRKRESPKLPFQEKDWSTSSGMDYFCE